MRNSDYKIKPISISNVKITDNFWSSRIETNRKITIPHLFKKSEETGRINNFSRAAGILKDGGMPIFPFDDSDVFKIIEAAAYSLILMHDPDLKSTPILLLKK